MARAESRRHEFAVRGALGATRARLLRQAMTEGLLLSVAGGIAGVWLAHLCIQGVIRIHASSLPRTSDVAIDLPVLLFAAVVSIGAGLLFGGGTDCPGGDPVATRATPGGSKHRRRR